MFYKLNNKTPVQCADPKEWSSWFEKTGASRTVARDEVGDAVLLTYFVGVDYNYYGNEKGSPLLFETMEFIDDKSTGLHLWSSTWDEAELTHRYEVEKRKIAGQKRVS